jgi:hypothetical protein
MTPATVAPDIDYPAEVETDQSANDRFEPKIHITDVIINCSTMVFVDTVGVATIRQVCARIQYYHYHLNRLNFV